MPRAKDRPILFEVIDRGKPLRSQPIMPPPADSANRSRPALPPEKRRPFFSSLVGSMARRHDAPSNPVPTLRDDAKPANPATAPILHLRFAGRDIALSWIGLVGTAAALVIITVALYQIGVRLARGRAADPASDDDALVAALNGAPDPGVLDLPASERRAGPRIAPPQPSSDTLLASDVRAAPNDSQSETTRSAGGPERLPVVDRKKGLYYVVVQHFQRSRDADARAAADFLASNGVPCGVVDSGKDLRIIAAESFNIDHKDGPTGKSEQARCNDLLRRIQSLGKQYSRTGRYTFRDCYADKY